MKDSFVFRLRVYLYMEAVMLYPEHSARKCVDLQGKHFLPGEKADCWMAAAARTNSRDYY